MKRSVVRDVVLCADDYGLNEGVSEGILALADSGRISATSCMTTSPAWREAAAALGACTAPIGIGLHLTLTLGRPLGPMPRLAGSDGAFPRLGTLLCRALAGELSRARPRQEIRQEIDRQLTAFERELGRPPDFVDGHQHVHVLPDIRQVLLAALADRYPVARPWLRDPSDRASAILGRRRSAAKAMLVGALAARFGREAREAGFRTNQGFSGFSALDGTRDPDQDMRRFLAQLGERPLVMCHPGLPDPAPDEIAEARPREHAYLSSDAFTQTLARRGVRLVPAPV